MTGTRLQRLSDLRRVRHGLQHPGKLDLYRADGAREWACFVCITVNFERSAAPGFRTGIAQPRTSNYLWYLWCNTGCTNGANWAGSSVGTQGQAQDADLALDGLNRPRIAFRNMLPSDGLGYFWCDANCKSVSASWLGGLVEPSSDLDANGIFCLRSIARGSYWFGGYRPSLALDTAGNPRIGYVASIYTAGAARARPPKTIGLSGLYSSTNLKRGRIRCISTNIWRQNGIFSLAASLLSLSCCFWQ